MKATEKTVDDLRSPAIEIFREQWRVLRKTLRQAGVNAEFKHPAAEAAWKLFRGQYRQAAEIADKRQVKNWVFNLAANRNARETLSACVTAWFERRAEAAKEV